ncbi:membrane protein insertase YidC [Sesbania bispinosa]|nr:membrane protein insertase YidC [Sesbania bispinosa]
MMTWQTENTVNMMMWTLHLLLLHLTEKREEHTTTGMLPGPGRKCRRRRNCGGLQERRDGDEDGVLWDEEAAAVARRDGTTRSSGFTATEMRESVRDSGFLQPRRGPHSAVAVMVVLISCSGRSVGKLHFAVAVVDSMAAGRGFVMVIAGGGGLDLRW